MRCRSRERTFVRDLPALVVLLVSLGCSEAPDRVVIGVAVNPATHPAVELAIDRINAEGGIRGVPLEAMGLDWASGAADAAEIVEWAHRFADEPDLLGVVGHSDSAATLTSAAVYNRLEVPQLVTIATNPAITDIGPWTYRLCISDALQGPALAEYAVRDQGRRRIVLVYVNDEYGKGLAAEFRLRAEELGAEVVASALHENTLRDEDRAYLTGVLERLRGLPPEERPDLFTLIQRTQAGLWTVGEIRRLGFEAPILGGDNFSLTAFVEADPPRGEGLRAAAFFVEAPDTPEGRAFARGWRERSGGEPDYGAAYAYDAVRLFQDAVEAGGFSRAGVKGYLDGLIREERAVHGVTGTFRLGPDHDAVRDFFIVELRGDRFVRVATIPAR